MPGQLSLSVVEIIVLMLGAIFVGITIHFFLISRRSLRASVDETPGGRLSKEISEWKLKYFNDVEEREKEIADLTTQLAQAEENSQIFSIEAEEKSIKNQKLLAELAELKSQIPKGEKSGYIEELRQAQNSLLAHNEKISKLIGQIDFAKKSENKQREMQKVIDDLSREKDELKTMLADKEENTTHILHKDQISEELTSLIENAHTEFNTLQDKILKLENQVVTSKTSKLEYEEIKEGYFKISRDFEEQKLRFNVLQSENRQLQAHLKETEEKLTEANFLRQQMQKKVSHLEELNQDMQVVTDAKTKLESQLKRIGELENMLNIISKEKKEFPSQK